jgi:dTMP kinase
MDGSGKTTQFERLIQHLGKQTIGVREPGSTPLAERLRNVVKDGGLTRSTYANLFLFTAARADLVDTVIRPAIKQGKNVVSDRNWLSTAALQGAEGANIDLAWKISRMATREFFEPDLLLFIDLNPQTCRQRAHERGSAHADYFDRKSDNYYKQVRKIYLDNIQRIQHSIVIEGHGTPDEVWNRIADALSANGLAGD